MASDAELGHFGYEALSSDIILPYIYRDAKQFTPLQFVRIFFFKMMDGLYLPFRIGLDDFEFIEYPMELPEVRLANEINYFHNNGLIDYTFTVQRGDQMLHLSDAIIAMTFSKDCKQILESNSDLNLGTCGIIEIKKLRAKSKVIRQPFIAYNNEFYTWSKTVPRNSTTIRLDNPVQVMYLRILCGVLSAAEIPRHSSVRCVLFDDFMRINNFVYANNYNSLLNKVDQAANSNEVPNQLENRNETINKPVSSTQDQSFDATIIAEVFPPKSNANSIIDKTMKTSQKTPTTISLDSLSNELMNIVPSSFDNTQREISAINQIANISNSSSNMAIGQIIEPSNISVEGVDILNETADAVNNASSGINEMPLNDTNNEENASSDDVDSMEAAIEPANVEIDSRDGVDSIASEPPIEAANVETDSTDSVDSIAREPPIEVANVETDSSDEVDHMPNEMQSEAIITGNTLPEVFEDEPRSKRSKIAAGSSDAISEKVSETDNIVNERPNEFSDPLNVNVVESPGLSTTTVEANNETDMSSTSSQLNEDKVRKPISSNCLNIFCRYFYFVFY